MSRSAGPGVAIRDAATVVLLRDGSDGLEVWLQQRATTLVFAAGMHAFPGGAVDDEDRRASSLSFDPGAHAAVWRSSLEQAAALAVAAVRETEEEAGVVLPLLSLVPWSRWITPPGPPRRFDARFYVARMPDGQQARPRSSEVRAAEWVVVRSAVERHAAGDLPMWPPTIATLAELVPHETVAAALVAAPRTIEAVTG